LRYFFFAQTEADVNCLLTKTMACSWPFGSAAADAGGDSDDNVSNGAAPTAVLTCVAAADMNGQGACGAERGRPAVNHQDRQEVHILLMAVKAWPLGPDASCVVWVGSVSVLGSGRVRETR